MEPQSDSMIFSILIVYFKALMEEEQDNLSSSSSSSSDEENETKSQRCGQTHVTVCDINQAMLDVGKKKADDMGIRSGKGLNHIYSFKIINNEGIRTP